MGMGADDQTHAVIRKQLGPRLLILIGLKAVLGAVVHKDHGDVRHGFRLLQLAFDPILVVLIQQVDLIVIFRGHAVEAVGVVQQGDFDAVLLHHSDGIRVFLRAVESQNRHLRVPSPCGQGVGNARFAHVAGMVGCLTDHIEAHLAEGIRHFRRGAEHGIVAVVGGIGHQNGLLLDAGQIRLLDIVGNIFVDVRKVVCTVILLRKLIDGAVDQVVAYRHEIDRMYLRGGTGGRLRFQQGVLLLGFRRCGHRRSLGCFVQCPTEGQGNQADQCNDDQ